MTKTLLLGIFLFGCIPAARAANVCTPVEELHELSNFCEDNGNYPRSAESCLAVYRGLVDAKKTELEKVLAGQFSGSTLSQQGQLQANENAYASAQATLQALIARGNQVIDEFYAYGDDFVPPIPSDAVGHWKPNFRDPNDPARAPDLDCWSIPAGELDEVIAEAKRLVKELEVTKAKTDQLKVTTGKRNDSLSDLSQMAGSRGAIGSGRSPRDSSTVTGELDRGSLDTAAAKGKRPERRLAKEQAAYEHRWPSSPTQEAWSAAQNGFSGISGVSSRHFVRRAVSSSGRAAPAKREVEEGTSVGSVAWSETNNPKKIGLELNLVPEAAPAAAEGGLSNLGKGASDGGLESSPAEHSRSVRAAKDTQAATTAALVSTETTLFVAVRQCYHRSVLFRDSAGNTK